jgi:hypothetical protein
MTSTGTETYARALSLSKRLCHQRPPSPGTELFEVPVFLERFNCFGVYRIGSQEQLRNLTMPVTACKNKLCRAFFYVWLIPVIFPFENSPIFFIFVS